MARKDKGTHKPWTLVRNFVKAMMSDPDLSEHDKAVMAGILKLAKSADARRKYIVDPSISGGTARQSRRRSS